MLYTSDVCVSTTNKSGGATIMQTNEIAKTAAALYERMERDGYNQGVIDTARWVIGHFEKYCHSCVSVKPDRAL